MKKEEKKKYFLIFLIISAIAIFIFLNMAINIKERKEISLSPGLDQSMIAFREKPDFDGYIIQFQEEPLVKKKINLEKEKISKSEIRTKLESHEGVVLNEHQNVKNKILTKLNKNRFVKEKAAKNEIKELGEFYKVFNGIALDISENEAKKLKEIPEVKEVYPNYKVNITLMDSVPLIGADQVWQMDANGNDCSISGNPCLTGEGTTIAIIDTGIDYTHEDLGGTGESISFDQEKPNIHENKIVWSENRDIYMCDMVLNGQNGGCQVDDTKIQITNDPYNQDETPLIYGDKIVWHDDRNGEYDVYMYDISTGQEIQITNEPYFQNAFSMYDNKIVGLNSRGIGLDVYVYDIQTGEESQITDDSYSQLDPVIYRDKIVWHDNRNGNYDLFMYDLSTMQEFQITSESYQQYFPSIYENKIVWSENEDIYMCDISFNGQDGGCLVDDRKTQITENPRGQGHPDIYADKIVWRDNRNDNYFDIYSYDLITNIETQLTTNSRGELLPQIYNDKIVWNDYRNGNYDIYMYDLSLSQEIQITGEDISEWYPNSKVIGGYDFSDNDNDPMDYHGHGTHVAATAAGNGVLKGVAPDAKIYAYKVFPNSYANVIISAIERAVDPNQDGIFDDHLDIISMSLGGGGDPDDPMSQAVDNAVDTGIVAVIAAGNWGPRESSISSPGTARKAITVGATDKSDIIAYFSSRGPVAWIDSDGNKQYLIKPDVVAPGVSICAAQWDDAWSSYQCFDDNHVAISGTSMATPHVAGAVALLKQKNPDWTPEEIKMALRNTAVDLGYDINTQGYGRIDVLQAINSGKPPLAKLDPIKFDSDFEGITGKINIIGSAKADNFKEYRLYYGHGKDPFDFIEFYSSGNAVEDSILYGNFDSSLLSEGDNIIKLVVYNLQEIKSEDNLLLVVDNILISHPLNNDIFRLGDEIDINGSILFEDYNYDVYYSLEDSENWQTEGITKIIGQEGKLAKWDTSFLTNSGFYKIKLKVNYNTREITEHIRSIYIDSSLKEGWPVRILFHYEPLEFETTSEFIILIPRSNEDKNNASITILTKEEFLKNLYTSSGYYYWAGYLEPVVSDLDKDGDKEIVVFRGGNPPEVLVYNYDGSLLWKRSFGNYGVAGGNLHIPLIGDLDNDGYDEIIAYNFKDPGSGDLTNSELYVFNHDSSLLWRVNVPKDFKPTMLMADLNLDGNKEIVIKGNDAWEQKMVILNNLGVIISTWDIPKSYIGSPLQSSPAIGNFDDDSELEIVAVVMSPRGGYDDETVSWLSEAMIYVYNIDGSVVSGWPVYIPGDITSSPVVGDINNDGQQEIVVGLIYASNIFPDYNFGGLYAFDRNGNILSGWPVEKGWNFWSTPALADIDNDGDLEISASKLGFVTYLLHHDGSLVNENWPRYTYWNDYYGSIIGDVNNDNSLDVLTTAGGIYSCQWDNCGGVYGWNRDGSSIERFPKVTEIDAQAPAVIDDIDNDGKIELLASSDWDLDIINNLYKFRGSIYVWELDGVYNPETLPWPMFQHDPQHTGCYDCNKPKAKLHGKILLERRNFLRRNNSNTLSITLKNLETGNIKSHIVKSDYSGDFELEIESGNYNIWIKPKYWLAVRNDNVQINTGENYFDFGISRFGDFSEAGTSYNKVDFFDLPQFAGAYGSQCGQATYRWYIDANDDCKVNFFDISPFGGNYGLSGASPP